MKPFKKMKNADLEKMYKKSYSDIDRIIWNKPATIVFLKTGEKGIAKVQKGDRWNRELGFWVAYAKAMQEKLEPMRNIRVAVEQCTNLVQKAIEYKKVKLQEKCVDANTDTIEKLKEYPYDIMIRPDNYPMGLCGPLSMVDFSCSIPYDYAQKIGLI